MLEEWRPVVGYEEAYEVSNLGQVRSVDRVVGNGQPLRGRLLTLGVTSDGKYLFVNLWRENRYKSFRVHALVAEAFIGPRPPKMLVLHGNGRSFDNRLSNLRYGTHSDNLHDAVSHGTHWCARRACCIRGHEFGGANLIRDSRQRRCRACLMASRRRHDSKVKGEPDWTPEQFDRVADSYYREITSKESG